jgi:hypothetical protein
MTPNPQTHEAPPTDAWIAEHAAIASRAPTRGRVLRVKLGYNPNSSSVGSVVSMLAWTATLATVALNVIAATVAREARRDAPPGDEQP